MRWKSLTKEEAKALGIRKAQMRSERIETQRKKRREREAEWTPWFAWRPCWDGENGYGMFFETVLRRKENPMWTASEPIGRFLLGWTDWTYRPVTFTERDLGLEKQP